MMVKEPFDVEAAIKTYRLLITSSPPANQYLLLYVLDLLAVFARESEKNLMPASSECLFIDSFFLSSNFLTSPDCLLLRSSHLSFLLSDLALIFQPGIFSNPTHLTSSNEHKIAVEVLEFLIEHQESVSGHGQNELAFPLVSIQN